METTKCISRTNVINLFILGIAIILVCVVKTKFSDLFVGQVPMVQGMNGYGAQGNLQGNLQVNENLQRNPYVYPNQIYPDRIPYYPEFGRPCENGGCGVLGKCENGSCNAIPYNKTVFGNNV